MAEFGYFFMHQTCKSTDSRHMNRTFACLDGLVASKIIKLSVLASIMLKYWQNHVPHAWCCNIAFGL